MRCLCGLVLFHRGVVNGVHGRRLGGIVTWFLSIGSKFMNCMAAGPPPSEGAGMCFLAVSISSGRSLLSSCGVEAPVGHNDLEH